MILTCCNIEISIFMFIIRMLTVMWRVIQHWRLWLNQLILFAANKQQPQINKNIYNWHKSTEQYNIYLKPISPSAWRAAVWAKNLSAATGGWRASHNNSLLISALFLFSIAPQNTTACVGLMTENQKNYHFAHTNYQI